MKRTITAVFAAFAFLAFLAFAALPLGALAQPAQHGVSSPRISGFDVEPVAQATPGSELQFTLYGSPGGTARVQINGGGNVLLDEVEPGVYEGAYTIRQRDRINAASAATVNLRVGNRVATSLLDESLVAASAQPRSIAAPVAVAGGPTIERFDVSPANRLTPPADLFFTLDGTPGGTASVRIAGVPGRLVLDEVRRGVYEGTYDVRGRDRIVPDAVVTANLRVGSQETSRLLNRPLMAPNARPVAQRAPEACLNCGVVEAINPVEVKGNGSYVGKIAGGVVGALLGSQVGSGSGRTAAQIAGAVGGAFAGNEIEKRTRTETHYEVIVRLANGGTQTISYANTPPFAVGAKVRIENGELKTV
ncbi:MAG: glycine zipper 2TM domain-containing protein [Caldimonas sp.]